MPHIIIMCRVAGSLCMHSIRFEHRRARGWPAVTRVMSRDCRMGSVTRYFE